MMKRVLIVAAAVIMLAATATAVVPREAWCQVLGPNCGGACSSHAACGLGCKCYGGFCRNAVGY